MVLLNFIIQNVYQRVRVVLVEREDELLPVERVVLDVERLEMMPVERVVLVEVVLPLRTVV